MAHNSISSMSVDVLIKGMNEGREKNHKFPVLPRRAVRLKFFPRSPLFRVESVPFSELRAEGQQG